MSRYRITSIAALLSLATGCASSPYMMPQPLDRIPSATKSKGAGNDCGSIFGKAPDPTSFESLLRDPEAAWKLSTEMADQLQLRFENSEYVVHALLTGILAKEFIWLNGDPGGAKTMISRFLFASELRGLSRDTKRIFLLQFHKLLNEGVITGFPKIKAMLEDGTYERNYDDALIADKFIFLIADEVEKAHPALQSTLLSVLNERKAFLGSQVVNTLLASGVFTSNKTLGKLIETSGDDRAAIEALIDRMAVKGHVINQTVDALGSMRRSSKIEWSQANPWNGMSGALSLSQVVSNVRIPKQLIEEFASIITKIDAFYIERQITAEEARKTGKGLPFFAPNQFSNRSVVKLVQTWKAAFIARQIMEGKSYEDMRWDMRPEDIRDCAIGALMNGPGGIRYKSVKAEVEVHDPDIGVQLAKSSEAAYEPATGRLTFYLVDGTRVHATFDTKTWEVLTQSRYLDTTSGQVRSATEVLDLPAVVAALKKLQKANASLSGLEQDELMGQYLATKNTETEKSLPAATRDELQFISDSRDLFVNLANASITKLAGKKLDFDAANSKRAVAKAQLALESERLARELNAMRANGKSVDPFAFYSLAAETVKHSFDELSTDYRELDHSILAHFVGILARTHLFVYGPPGGAKTSLAKAILSAVLRTMNDSARSEMMNVFQSRVMAKYRDILDKMKAEGKPHEEYELFFRQFHKMVPEGEIVGFQKLNEQLDSGKIAYDRTNSMSHERFAFAILDEVEKGNPALLQTLLSILNEREVFAGHEVVKATLFTAIMTSNKVPFEFLQAFGDDFESGLALMDRAINKVFVNNKFADDKQLVDMLLDVESGTFNPGLTSPLMLVELQELLPKVKIPEKVKLFLFTVVKSWQAKALARHELTKEAFEVDRMDNPSYYVAASNASNRAEEAQIEQLKANWLVRAALSGKLGKTLAEQKKKGVSFDEVNFEVTFEDAALLAQGLTYWAPIKYVSTYDARGILQFDRDKSELQMLISSPRTTPRLKYQLEMMELESKELVELMNDELAGTVQRHRELIGKFPHLFPGLSLPKP